MGVDGDSDVAVSTGVNSTWAGTAPGPPTSAWVEPARAHSVPSALTVNPVTVECSRTESSRFST